MFLEQPEVSELLVLGAMVSDQGVPQQSSGGAASCSVLPAVGDGRLHGPDLRIVQSSNRILFLRGLQRVSILIYADFMSPSF